MKLMNDNLILTPGEGEKIAYLLGMGQYSYKDTEGAAIDYRHYQAVLLKQLKNSETEEIILTLDQAENIKELLHTEAMNYKEGDRLEPDYRIYYNRIHEELSQSCKGGQSMPRNGLEAVDLAIKTERMLKDLNRHRGDLKYCYKVIEALTEDEAKCILRHHFYSNK